MAVFYRTYRPQTFNEVVGQKPIVTTLVNSVKNNNIAHAYLFTGSRGVGKTTIARLLAKAVNCLKVKHGEPCGVCDVCMAIQNNLFIDLVEIDAASHTGVDNVRELIEHIKFKPTSGKYKVFIIDEVHMLSKSAFNALLKTLEEPPQHAIFILATTDIHKVPSTIISRTQRFDFGRIAITDIVEQLDKVARAEKLKVEPAVLNLIARQSQGSLRDGLSLLNKVSTGGGKVSLTDAEGLLGVASLVHYQQLVSHLATKDASAISNYFDQLDQQGIDFPMFNKGVLDYLRGLLVLKVTGNVYGLYTQEEQQTMSEQIVNISAVQIMHWIRLFLRAYKDLTIAPEPSLALLLAAMEAVVKPESAPVAVAQPMKPDKLVFNSENTVAPQLKTTDSTAGSTTTQTSVLEDVAEEVELEDFEQSDPYTIEEVKQFWPQLLDRLRLINSPLATLVKNSPVTKVSGPDIFLTVKYLFHKEHLESKKVLGLLHSNIAELGGRPGRIRVEIGNNTSEQSAGGADAISEALRVFGGELVE